MRGIKTQIILVMFILIQVVQFGYFIKDNEVSGWDESWHSMISVNKYNQLLGKTNYTTKELETIYPMFNYFNTCYPPLLHYTTVPYYILLDKDYNSGLYLNLTMFIILIVSTFYIGKIIKGEKTGLISAAIVSTIPLYSRLIRLYLIDMMLTSIVALSFLILLKTKKLKKHTILLSIVLGAGMLTKWTYFIYMGFPVSYALYQKIKKKGINIETFYPFFFAFFISYFLWYNPKTLYLAIPKVLSFSKHLHLIIINESFTYLALIIQEYSLLYFCVFIFSVYYILKKKKLKKSLLIIFLTIMVPFLILNLISNKQSRYIAPIFFFMAILSGYAINIFKIKKYKTVIIAIILFLGLAQNIAFNHSSINHEIKFKQITLFTTKGFYSYKGYDINSILDSIPNGSRICIVAESSRLNDVMLPYYAIKDNYNFSYMAGSGCNPLNFDYSIVGPIEESWRKNQIKYSEDIINSNLNDFELFYSIKDVKIYKKVVSS